jgi:hypothetical protein
VAVGEHDAILVIGGKGAMLDLPRDAALARLLHFGRHQRPDAHRDLNGKIGHLALQQQQVLCHIPLSLKQNEPYEKRAEKHAASRHAK